MKSVKEVLEEMGRYLERRKIPAPKRQAEELLGAALNLKRLDLYLNFERPLVEAELAICRDFLKRAGQGEPLAYIFGKVEFCDLKLKVDKRVLIPRPETELIVEQIIGELEDQPLAGKKLWDLCTGSGCIALAIKKGLPALEVVGSDFSKEALEVARENKKSCDLEVSFYHGDFLEGVSGQVDYLVTNPPYVTEEEYQKAPLLHFEPRMAFVGGLTFYERLAKQLLTKLKPGGRAWIEIGAGQGKAVKEIFSHLPLSRLALSQDLAGHDRLISLEPLIVT